MAKLDIDFVLLDESVVMYGFRCLMAGGRIEDFIKNPVLLTMHRREDNASLPIGKWVDIRFDGAKLLAKPEFDDDDELAVKIQKKVQKGYLNGASVALLPTAVSDDAKLKLKGQSLPTITEWSVYEASIVDIPNCKNALAIRNSAGKQLQLSADGKSGEAIDYLNSLIPTENFMDKKLLAATLGLAENSTDADVTAKLSAVVKDANNAAALSAEITKLKGDLSQANTTLETLKAEATAKRNNELVDGAIAAKKLAAGERDTWLQLAAANYEAAKLALDKMTAFEGIEGRLSAGTPGSAEASELEGLMKLSGRDLYLQGKFEHLKKLSAEAYRVKYAEYFGSEPK